MRKISVFLMALCVVAMAGTAGATTIVDTGAPTAGSQWSLNDNQWLAGTFDIVGQSTIVTDALIHLGFANGGTYTVAIYEGASFFDSPTPPELFSGVANGNSGWSGVSGVSWLLDPGSYWVTFEVRAGDTFDGTASGNNAPNPLSNYSFRNPDGGDVWFDYQPVLDFGVRVLGDPAPPVPEPASMALLGMGLVGMVARKRRK